MKKVYEFILKNSILVILVFALITAGMFIGIGNITKDTSADSMRPTHNEIVLLNKKVEKDYSTGAVVLAILSSENIFSPFELNKIRALTEKLENTDGVKKVTSFTNSTKMIEDDGMLLTSEMVEKDNLSPEEIDEIIKYTERNYTFKDGTMVSRDHKNTTILVELNDNTDVTVMSDKIEGVIKTNWQEKYSLAGSPVMEKSIKNIIAKDLPVLIVLALILILFFFYLNFRSIHGVVLPFFMIFIGLIWGVGSYSWLGYKMQSLTVIGTVALLAIGSSFSLHLLGRYYFELAHGKEKREAILTTFEKTGLGVMISGLAISVAMCTFLISDIPMVSNLGVLTAIGVFSCLINAVVLFPALLNILPKPKIKIDPENPGSLGIFLKKLSRWVVKNKKKIVAVGVILFIFGGIGASKLVPNSSIIAFFNQKSDVVKGTNAVEKVLGGSTTLTLVIDGDLNNPDLLKGMLEFQEKAKLIDGAGPAQSLATIVRNLNETLTGNAGMPDTREGVAQEILVYQASSSVSDITSLSNLDYTQGIIKVFVKRLSTHETKALVSQLKELSEKTIGDKAKVTFVGDAFIDSIMEEALLHDFIISLTLAILLVIIIDSFVRSIPAALVTITSIIITISLQYGLMGFLNIPLNLASMIMGALAIGVGDYAIHFTVRYMEELGRGQTPEKAVEEAVFTSGRSIVFTAFTLGAGFSSLAFAQFVPVATLGQLMVFTVFSVGIASIVLLPAICLIFLRKINIKAIVN